MAGTAASSPVLVTSVGKPSIEASMKTKLAEKFGADATIAVVDESEDRCG